MKEECCLSTRSRPRLPCRKLPPQRPFRAGLNRGHVSLDEINYRCAAFCASVSIAFSAAGFARGGLRAVVFLRSRRAGSVCFGACAQK
jgi:hypothetical protein